MGTFYTEHSCTGCRESNPEGHVAEGEGWRAGWRRAEGGAHVFLPRSSQRPDEALQNCKSVNYSCDCA